METEAIIGKMYMQAIKYEVEINEKFEVINRLSDELESIRDKLSKVQKSRNLYIEKCKEANIRVHDFYKD